MIFHFNFQNYLWLEQFGNMPAFPQTVFIAFTPLQARRLGGIEAIATYFRSWKQRFPVHQNVYLHLDHARTLKLCYRAIAAGFNSIMFDASLLSFKQNLALTKKLVSEARKANVWVEAELGILHRDKYQKTDSAQVQSFTETTQVDYLAVAVGNYHGIQSIPPIIDWNLLRKIKQLSRAPIVLHGASGIAMEVLQALNGAKLIGKINFDTDLQRQFLNHWAKLDNDNYYQHQATAFKAVQRWILRLFTLLK